MSDLPSVDTARVERIQVIGNETGVLMVAEQGRQVPFAMVRTFVVTGVPPGTMRGHHAHKQCHQLLVCLAGRLTVRLHDGTGSRVLTLEQPGDCVHVLPGLWAEQVYEAPSTTLMVLCDQPYDETDYLRDFKDFQAWRAQAAEKA
jgi:UDP-2-acetamido-3-amino-2,3-dideoxy-glucuronate N-acetyltransferase